MPRLRYRRALAGRESRLVGLDRAGKADIVLAGCETGGGTRNGDGVRLGGGAELLQVAACARWWCWGMGRWGAGGRASGQTAAKQDETRITRLIKKLCFRDDRAQSDLERVVRVRQLTRRERSLPSGPPATATAV